MVYKAIIGFLVIFLHRYTIAQAIFLYQY